MCLMILFGGSNVELYGCPYVHTHTCFLCRLPPAGLQSPPRKNFEDSFNVGIRISANLTDIQMKIEALLTSLSKNRRSVTGSSFPANPVVVSLLFIQFLLTYPAPQSTLSVHLQHFTAFITLILVVLMPEHNCKLQQD